MEAPTFKLSVLIKGVSPLPPVPPALFGASPRHCAQAWIWSNSIHFLIPFVFGTSLSSPPCTYQALFREYEETDTGGVSIFKENISVGDVTNIFTTRNADWVTSVQAEGMTGSGFTKAMIQLKCSHPRKSSIVLEAGLLKSNPKWNGLGTGDAVISRLMSTLEKAGFVVALEGGKTIKYRLSESLFQFLMRSGRIPREYGRWSWWADGYRQGIR